MGHINIFRQNTHIHKAFLKANQHKEKETLLQQLRQYMRVCREILLERWPHGQSAQCTSIRIRVQIPVPQNTGCSLMHVCNSSPEVSRDRKGLLNDSLAEKHELWIKSRERPYFKRIRQCHKGGIDTLMRTSHTCTHILTSACTYPHTLNSSGTRVKDGCWYHVAQHVVSKQVPHKLRYLNACSPVGGSVWGGLSMVLLDEMSLEQA